jgi:hypothetical protein
MNSVIFIKDGAQRLFNPGPDLDYRVNGLLEILHR